MEENKKDFVLIRQILSNNSLLKWVKKFSAEGLVTDDKSEMFEISKDENTISLSDTTGIKIFFSGSKFSGKAFMKISIKQIKEVLSLIDGEGELIVSNNKDKSLCYVESDNNVVVIAPLNNEEDTTKDDVKEEE